MPGVCAVLGSSEDPGMTRTPSCFHFGACSWSALLLMSLFLSQHITFVPAAFGASSEATFVGDYCARRAALAKRLASSAARNSAFALSTHSCCSDLGLESATMPAPACTYILPSLMSAVRRTMQLSSSPAAEKYPTAPA